MARHRSSDGRGQQPRVLVEEEYDYLSTSTPGTRSSTGSYRVSGSSRVASPSSAVRGRVVVAAVALGAFAAAAAGQTLQGPQKASTDLPPLADGSESLALMGMGGDGYSSAAPDILTVSRAANGAADAKKMVESERINQARAASLKAAQDEAARPKYVKPAEGSLTSGFGSRWGTTHYGVDIANRIGTPIYAITDGVVLEAGPASGFGLWVRVQHADGMISVYGHMDSFSVREGQKVKAGQQIARMGNRGYSTGPHLHFEIWDASGKKLNPAPWLSARGVKL